ncbi:MAG: gluconeogenesis factor YvcK family protein [Actinomycetota bacterium]
MKVVGIGGGHGLAATLRAAREYADDIAAVVTVADDGGSSGRLTRELGIPPPGDIRNCLVALAGDTELGELYQHRFVGGLLTGHTLGNLVIAALAETTHDFAAAVARAGELLKCEGHVYPATTHLVELGAHVEGGEIEGQVAVAQTKTRIESVFLAPADPPPCVGAVNAIRAADQIVLGPGSLYTSLIATLLVPGIGSAVRHSKAHKIFVCNGRPQKGETEDLDATAHLRALIRHGGEGIADTMVVQRPELEDDGVEVDIAELEALGVTVVEADVVRPDGGHDPGPLAGVLSTLSR